MNKIDKFALAVSIGDKKFITKNGFSDMQKSNIKAIELSFNDYTDIDFSEIKNFADEFNVKLWSLHLPFMPFEEIDISSTDNEIREKTVDLICELISQSVDIGIDRFVVHASGEPVLPPVRTERKKCSRDSLYLISEFAKKYNSVIAVENLPRTCLGNCSSEINELTSVNDNLLICFDTNHLFLETAQDFVANLNKKIETVHISDYDFQYERHWLPLCGKIDWNLIINLLNKKKYNGPFMYEVSFSKGKFPFESDLNFGDFYINYSNLFNGGGTK